MKNDIRRYISLRDSLIQEKSKLESRLREISEALGESSEQRSTPTLARPAVAASGRRGRRSSGGLSLRDAVLQVTSRGPLTKQEILDGVQQLGYRFSTNNPANSLGVILYGKNPRFKNDDGRFSPAGAPTSPRGQSSTQNGGRGKRRKLSPEARERIAAAQRARWAKSKGSK